MNKKSIILWFSIVIVLLMLCSGTAFAADETITESTDKTLLVESTTPEMRSQDVIDPNTSIYSDESHYWETEATGKRRYFYDGVYLSQAVYMIDNEYYAFDKTGYMVLNCWHSVDTSHDKVWYYAKTDGKLAREEWIGDFYFRKDGKMATSAWIYDETPDEPYYVGEDGKYIPNQWKHDAGGWWYQLGDGTYPKNEIKKVEKVSYAFDEDGYLKISTWHREEHFGLHGVHYPIWYYAKEDGSLASNEWIGDYFLNVWGEMVTSDWIWDVKDHTDYYVNADGKYVPNHWKHDSKGWWYQLGDGTYAKDEVRELGGTLYAFDKYGYMRTNAWHNEKQSNESESPYWVWYYAKKDGTLATNEWIGNYYFHKDGKMATSEWIWDVGLRTNYYVDADGKYIPNHWEYDAKGWKYRLADGGYVINRTWSVDSNLYVFDENGYMISTKGWHSILHRLENGGSYNKWYYIKKDGTLAANEWIGNYCFYDDGEMITSQ